MSEKTWKIRRGGTQIDVNEAEINAEPQPESVEIATWCRTIASSLQAGQGILDVLRSASDSVSNLRLKVMTEAVDRNIREGGAIAEGMRKFPFLQLGPVCDLMDMGEETGNVDVMLREAARIVTLSPEDESDWAKLVREDYPAYLFTLELGMLQEAGLPILRSLRILSHLPGDGSERQDQIRKGILVVCKAIELGSTLSVGMQAAGVFPQALVDVVRKAEEDGDLDTALLKYSGCDLKRSEASAS